MKSVPNKMESFDENFYFLLLTFGYISLDLSNMHTNINNTYIHSHTYVFVMQPIRQFAFIAMVITVILSR